MIKKFSNFFGIPNVQAFVRDVKQNGGIRATLNKQWKMDQMRAGCFVGEDKYGNRYFEDLTRFFGRSRWVEYPKYKNFSYDGSQVSPEWYGWLHYVSDTPPHADIAKLKTRSYKWILDHSENLSGTTDAYMPYSTTKLAGAKIVAWNPKEPKGQQ